MISFEAFITKRYLKIRHEGRLVPLITILATTGVALGVMVLMVVIAVMTGFQSELKKRILGIESDAVVMRYHEWISLDQDFLDTIEKVDGVQSAAPFVYAQGMMRSAHSVSGILLRGVDPQRSGLNLGALNAMQLEHLLSDDTRSDGPGNLVLGSVMADKLKVIVGDEVMVMVAGNRTPSVQHLPQMHRLKVVGLFDTGMHQYDGTMGFVGIRPMQRILGLNRLVTGIEIRVVDPDAVGEVGGRISAALGDAYWVNTWQQMHRNLFAMLFMQKLMMYVVLTLIILVAAFNVASALIMMVKEKTRDIAILKAMGATNGNLQRIFLGKGLIIGLVGVLIGLMGGAVICFLLSRYQFIHLPGDIYFLTTLPVRVEFGDLAIIVLGTLGICFFASLYPARRAARMDAVVGIRYS